MTRTPGWDEAREERAGRSQHDAHRDRPAIQVERQTNPDVADDRQPAEEQHTAVAHRQAQSAASNREQEAFGDQLARDANAVASDRKAQRDLFLAYRRAAHQEARDVRARDQQNDERKRHQHERARRGGPALLEASVERGSHQHPVVAIGVGVGLLQAAGDRGGLLSCLLE